MTRRRSSAAGWVAIAVFVIVWDVVAPRCGFETLSTTWRRWGRDRPTLRLGLSTSLSCLDRHLTEWSST